MNEHACRFLLVFCFSKTGIDFFNEILAVYKLEER